MKTIDLQVEGMSCGSCVKHVTHALQPLPGVSGVEVDLQSGHVRVSGELAQGSAPGQLQRPPAEVRLLPGSPLEPAPERAGRSWELLRWGPARLGPLELGPVVVTRRSAELGLNSATLLFTLIHSANLLLLTTAPEELVWAIAWFLRPFAALGLPVERLGFILLLSLRCGMSLARLLASLLVCVFVFFLTFCFFLCHCSVFVDW